MLSPRAILWYGIAVLAVAGAAATRLGTRWPTIYYMTGSSMEPTLAAGEYFLAWSPARNLGPGSLVLFRFVDEDGEFHVLRRLVAFPGDTIALQDGRVILNGHARDWPYRIQRPAAWRSTLAIGGNLFTWGPWIVPNDSVVLLADTRDMTGWPDSRFVGFVAVDQIVATAARTLWGRRLQ